MTRPTPTLGAILEQPRVTRRLDGLVSGHSLTVIAAPAGAGKTTAIRHLLERRPEPGAWLTMQPRLDDPAALAAALGAVIGGEATLSVLVAQSADPGRLAGALAEDLDTRPAIVVLDDAHLVRSPAAGSMLCGLAELLGPSARMVIAARGKAPLALARLRSAGCVAEVGGDELRFSAADARALAKLLGVEADATALAVATDGSPALLGLALLAGDAGTTPQVLPTGSCSRSPTRAASAGMAASAAPRCSWRPPRPTPRTTATCARSRSADAPRSSRCRQRVTKRGVSSGPCPRLPVVDDRP